MAGGIWEAIGAALQQGAGTYNAVSQQQQAQREHEARLRLQQEQEARQAEYQNAQMEMQRTAFAQEQQDRKIKQLQDAIAGAQGGQDLSMFEDQIRTEAPHLLPQLNINPGGMSMNATRGLGASTATNPLGLAQNTAPILEQPRQVTKQTSLAEQAAREQLITAQRTNRMFDEAFAPSAPAATGATGATTATRGLTPDQRLRLAVTAGFPGVNANEVLGTPPATRPQTGNGVGEAALDGLSDQDKQMVRKIANYEFPLPVGRAQTDPYWKDILVRVSSYDPSFDATQYTPKVAAKRDFLTPNGRAGRNITSINTAIGHMKSLADEVANLDNSSFPAYNAVSNWAIGQGGDDRVVKTQTAVTALEAELASLFKGTGATDQEIKAWRESFSTNQSPDQMQAAIGKSLELLKTRLLVLDQQYANAMGKPRDFAILLPESVKILEEFGVDAKAVDPIAGQARHAFERSGNMSTPGAPGSSAAGMNMSQLPMSQLPTGAPQTAAPAARTMTVDQVNRYAASKGVAPKDMVKILQDRGVVIQGLPNAR